MVVGNKCNFCLCSHFFSLFPWPISLFGPQYRLNCLLFARLNSMLYNRAPSQFYILPLFPLLAWQHRE